MKFFQSIMFSFLLLYLHYATNAQTPMFQKTWGATGQDYCHATNTNDSGYVLLLTMNNNSSYTTTSILKTNKYGDSLWSKTFSYSNIPVKGRSIISSIDGNYYLATIDSMNYPRTYKVDDNGNILLVKELYTGGQLSPTYDGGYVAAAANHIMKYDSLLNIQFYKSYAGPNDHGTTSKAVQTTDSGYIMVGLTRDMASGGFNDWDIYLAKTDKYGTLLWDNTFGNANGFDFYKDIIQTFDGGYLILGHTQAIGAGGWDILLIKTDPMGNQQWCKTYGDIGDDYSVSIKKVIGGTDYYIVGTSQGMETSFFNAEKTVLFRVSINGTFIFGKMFCDTNSSSIAEKAINSSFSTYDGGIALFGFTNAPQDAWAIKCNNTGASGCNEININPTTFSYTLSSTNGGIETTYNINSINVGQHIITYDNIPQIIICTNNIITGSPETPTTNKQPLIYPNPSNGIFTIDAEYLKSIAVYDVLGKQILIQQSSAQKTTIDLTPQPNGIYFLQCILNNGEVVNQKIVKQ